MLTLYHFPRAICAQKVRLALAEKGVAFESRIVTPPDLRSAEYLALNPNGYVPTLVHDGAIITESRTINEYIDEAFPNPSLMPASPLDRARLRNWVKQIDDSLHLNVFILTFVTSFRADYLNIPPEEREKGLPLNPIKRLITVELGERGADSAFFKMATERFRTLLAEMDAALAKTEWLSGDMYGMADVDYTPYLRRLAELGFWQLVAKDHPHVQRWFQVLRSRPSFSKAIEAWETDADRAREAEDIVRARATFEAALAA